MKIEENKNENLVEKVTKGKRMVNITRHCILQSKKEFKELLLRIYVYITYIYTCGNASSMYRVSFN